jgi:hypothetical protein
MKGEDMPKNATFYLTVAAVAILSVIVGKRVPFVKDFL